MEIINRLQYSLCALFSSIVLTLGTVQFTESGHHIRDLTNRIVLLHCDLISSITSNVTYLVTRLTHLALLLLSAQRCTCYSVATLSFPFEKCFKTTPAAFWSNCLHKFDFYIVLFNGRNERMKIAKMCLPQAERE